MHTDQATCPVFSMPDSRACLKRPNNVDENLSCLEKALHAFASSQQLVHQFSPSSQSAITHVLSDLAILDPNHILADELLKHKLIYIVMGSIRFMMLTVTRQP